MGHSTHCATPVPCRSLRFGARSTNGENVAVLHVCASSKEAPRYTKQKLIEGPGEIEKSITLETSLPTAGRASRQESSGEPVGADGSTGRTTLRCSAQQPQSMALATTDRGASQTVQRD